jgi:UDP-N-acetylmuramate dehydrogenase
LLFTEATLEGNLNEIEPYHLNSSGMQTLLEVFAERLQQNIPLRRYTSARIGGPAEALLEVNSGDDLVEACRTLWRLEISFIILGGGANVLVSDSGVRGVALINRARQVRFDETTTRPTVWVESGANLGAVARQAAAHGLAGLEWAAGIPGTIGGAVVGNAGAHGGDMASNLLVAEILHHDRGKEQWRVEQLEYQYRSSVLKRQRADLGELVGSPGGTPHTVVLAALLKLEHGDSQQIQARLDEFTAQRRLTQPPGASMGSMFRNPPGDYAGRLIEAAGLKGARSGDAQISSLHANFFVNTGAATAQDVYKLIRLAQKTVYEKFGVQLELEVELVGDWKSVG